MTIVVDHNSDRLILEDDYSREIATVSLGPDVSVSKVQTFLQTLLDRMSEANDKPLMTSLDQIDEDHRRTIEHY